MNVYLAARYPRREELLKYADELEDAGHYVVSSWLNGDDEVVENAGRYLSGASDVAAKDLEDLLQADVLISFTELAAIVPYLDAAARGGRHVEFGYAIGTGKTLFIVGPTENVFHTLSFIRFFDEWEPDIIEALDGLAGTKLARALGVEK